MKLKRFTNNRDIREKTESREKAAAVKKSAGRQLIVSSCLTFLCVLVLAAATMAWFANNREVDSNGMEIQVETSPNLVISDNIQTLAAMTSADAAFSAAFSSAAETLIPATHDWGTFNSNSETPVDSTTGLKYNCNPSVISPTSGYAKDSTHTLYYNKAENDATRVYYKDYTVFIASINKPLPADGLVAALSSNDTDDYDYQKAASVDFYVDVMSEDDYEDMVSANASDYTTMAADYVDDVCVDDTNYIGTLNLAKKGFTDTLSNLSSLDLAGGSTTVPLNTAGCITVVMRFYFDGALEKDTDQATDQAYVYSNNLSTADFTMKVTFTATGE